MWPYLKLSFQVWAPLIIGLAWVVFQVVNELVFGATGEFHSWSGATRHYTFFAAGPEIFRNSHSPVSFVSLSYDELWDIQRYGMDYYRAIQSYWEDVANWS